MLQAVSGVGRWMKNYTILCHSMRAYTMQFNLFYLPSLRFTSTFEQVTIQHIILAAGEIL